MFFLGTFSGISKAFQAMFVCLSAEVSKFNPVCPSLLHKNKNNNNNDNKNSNNNNNNNNNNNDNNNNNNNNNNNVSFHYNLSVNNTIFQHFWFDAYSIPLALLPYCSNL